MAPLPLPKPIPKKVDPQKLPSDDETASFGKHRGKKFSRIGKIYPGYIETSQTHPCLLYTSPSPRDGLLSRMPSSA